MAVSPTLRDAWLVARFDLAESLRTRRAVSLALLFLLVAFAEAWSYVGLATFVREQTQTSAIMRGAARSGYAMTLLRLADGDRAVADWLATQPPVALFHVHMALVWVPFLVVLTSSDLMARDLGTRAARYVLLRTSRLAWGLGRLLGQSLLIVAVLAASALLFLGVAAWRLPDFDAAGAAAGVATFAPYLCAHAIAFVALALLASQIASSAAWARALGLLLLAAVGLLSASGAIARWLDLPGALGHLAWLSPFHYQKLALRPEAWRRALAPLAHLAFAAATFAIGQRLLRARDV